MKTFLLVYILLMFTIYLSLNTLFTKGTVFTKHALPLWTKIFDNSFKGHPSSGCQGGVPS